MFSNLSNLFSKTTKDNEPPEQESDNMDIDTPEQESDNMDIDTPEPPGQILVKRNKLLGEGSFKLVYSVKFEPNRQFTIEPNREFTIDAGSNLDDYVIADINLNDGPNKLDRSDIIEEFKLQNIFAMDGKSVSVKKLKEESGSISVLMEKCTNQSIWDVDNIEDKFDILLDYLVNVKNGDTKLRKLILMDIKPDNLCNYKDNLIILDLDPKFIMTISNNKEESAKKCMVLLFCINILVDIKYKKIKGANITKAVNFIKKELKTHFGIEFKNDNKDKNIEKMVEMINTLNHTKQFTPSFMIRHYYNAVEHVMSKDADGLLYTRITPNEIRHIYR